MFAEPVDPEEVHLYLIYGKHSTIVKSWGFLEPYCIAYLVSAS